MSKIIKAAQAGTVESCDVLVTITPADPGTGVKVELISPTMQQYGEHIKNLIEETVIFCGVQDAAVHANEKGAMDYTIAARVRTAVSRAIG